MEKHILKMLPLETFKYSGRTILFRPDINSPIDPKTKKIVNLNRIKKALPTLLYLLNNGAKVAIIAHQGDTPDYPNLISMEEHAEKLSILSERRIEYIDDVCGPAAVAAVKRLKNSEGILLGNLRYLTEEVSTFESAVNLSPDEMLTTYLIKNLSPLADYYINDAFAAAHRNAPSMVAFQEILPSAAGYQLMEEYSALRSIMEMPQRPCVFLLGGAKISDAFGMMERILKDKNCDIILTAGVIGLVMLMAKGINLGKATEKFLKERSLDVFIPKAINLLDRWPEKFALPIDLACESQGLRTEIEIDSLFSEKTDDGIFPDIGKKTVSFFREKIIEAGSVFVNGPAGVYEDSRWAYGTENLWKAIEESDGYTVIGGGDTINAATKFTDLSRFSYVCTGGGAMIRFLSGRKLPLIAAMEKAYMRDRKDYSANANVTSL